MRLDSENRNHNIPLKRIVHIFLFLTVSFLACSCIREQLDVQSSLPDGTPVTVLIPFGAEPAADVVVGTKAEASRTDESRIRDLYVMIFDSDGNRFYGRYFTYEHKTDLLSNLGGNANEGWYVDNVAASDDAEKTTKGVVKIATEAHDGCTLVVIGNLGNAVTDLDGKTAIDRLAEITTLNELKGVKVRLQQNVVNRYDLFLMLGCKENVSTSTLKWYSGNTPNYTTPNYNPDSKISLNRIDAKVKFRIKVNSTNISDIESRYWQVCNVPSSCYLYPGDSDPSGDDRFYFDTEQIYFEGTETDGDGTWQVFSFYMLENRQTKKQHASEYYLREKQEKLSTGESIGVIYKNGDWLYAPDNGTYVRFDVILTLTPTGIAAINSGGGSALTTDAVFTVHLGDFTSSESGNFDNYSTQRNHAYSYDITIDNSNSIYVEVTDENRDTEPEAGQEGSLLFATDEIVQCDAHYEYHSLTFRYNAYLDRSKISWDVKTPFGEGGGNWVPDNPEYPAGAGHWEVDDKAIDYEWVLFALNGSSDGVNYDDIRQGYPGDSHYDKNWTPESTGDRPALLNVHQLILYIFDQTEKAKNGSSNDFKNEVIKMTAFVNEYYYEKDPRTGKLNPDLWREFVNAKSRELHILSDASVSADGRSDIVNSSHSIIQKSIQTIYNIYSPFLTSIWGTEHLDEMRNRGEIEEGYTVHSGWPWTSGGITLPDKAYCNSIENGRFNTAGLWGLNPSGTERNWNTYLNYDVENSVPELKEDHRLMVYSCLTRNRDNDGDGAIDPEEVRWYLASVNQVMGLWVGNEALSPSARIYQPHDASSKNAYEWRSHVVTSTCSSSSSKPRVVVAEEGTSLYDYPTNNSWDALNGSHAESAWNKIQSVRCVRNVGTYQDNGVTRDISYAPLDKAPDTYYEAKSGLDANGRLRPDDDGTYTLRFDNLNTKSIREYTAEDLPFHDEYSAHNRVYLELVMQNPSDAVKTDGTINEDMLAISNNITQTGYNSFCPPGYRIPSMTELALMVSLMPSSYWPSSSFNIPSRTYFSKGGSGLGYSSESGKTGWVYNMTYLALNSTGTRAGSIRCVRDNNLTGDISGKLILSKDRLYANEQTAITFNFSSSASPFTEATLALCYTDLNGDEREMSIPLEGLSFYGMTLRGTFNYTIPDSLPVKGEMTLKATLRNAANQVEEFSTPIFIKSRINASVRLLHSEHTSPSEAVPTSFPVLVNAISEDGTAITAWRLIVTKPDGSKTTTTLPDGQNTSWSMVYDYAFDSFNDLQTGGSYTFCLEVDDASGTTRPETVSMEILQRNYTPCPADIAESATQASDIASYTWEPQRIYNLSFAAGDFIETNMDISRCIYKNTGHDETSLGLDDLFSIGPNGIGWEYRTLHVYYPASSSSKIWLHPCYVYANDSYQTNLYPYKIAQTGGTVDDPNLLIRFDKNGLYYNNIADSSLSTLTDNSKVVVADLAAASSLYIGSTEGVHRSRATYYYVRVVHNGTSGDTNYTGGDFASDPEDGGYL